MGKRRVTAGDYGGFFRGDEDMLKLDCDICMTEYFKTPRIEYLKWVTLMLCEIPIIY